MLRLCIVVIATYGICCSLALGQQQPQQQPANSAAKPGVSATRERPTPPTNPQSPQPESIGALMQRSGGSLLRAGLASSNDPALVRSKDISPYDVPKQQPKTIKAHDLLTIIIREQSEMSSQGTADLKRESDLNAIANSFVKLNVKNLELEQAITGAAPQVNVSGSRNFKGEATVDRQDSFIARITAEVVDVKPNGTLVIQARKKIKHDEEEQTFICSGICRVEDVTPDNTVLSTQLFDLELTKMSKGQVRNTTKTGVIHKLLDFINPF